MNIAVANYPSALRKGNTLAGFYTDFVMDGNPLDIVSSITELSRSNGKWVYTWPEAINGGRVSCSGVAGAVTATWPTGELEYNMTLTLENGMVITVLTGKLTVTEIV